MDLSNLRAIGDDAWEIPMEPPMRVPGVLYASAELVESMDEKVREQVRNVAMLPGIVRASFAMPDAHWGYGFPIGGVAAFDPDEGVVSAGGVGFDVSCGVRCLTTGLVTADVMAVQRELVDRLYEGIPAGVGSEGSIRLDDREMDAMLVGGARWAVERGWGDAADLERIEEHGQMAGARPECVSRRAKARQRGEVGTLGSGNHYLEVERVAEIVDARVAGRFGIAEDDVVVFVHCGSRGLGHQIGTEFLARMVQGAEEHGIDLPDRELACAPLRSELGREYLGAMRAAINCALANREVLTWLTRRVFAEVLPKAELRVLYDVSHNTCKEEEHEVAGARRRVFVHRKGATRAFGPGHPELPEGLRDLGQPVLIGGSMGTESWVLIGVDGAEAKAFASACHGAGRRMSRRAAYRQFYGRQVVDQLARSGVLVRSPSSRGVAEEAPGAYKDVREVVESAERAGLARRVARVVPLVCVKG